MRRGDILEVSLAENLDRQSDRVSRVHVCGLHLRFESEFADRARETGRLAFRWQRVDLDLQRLGADMDRLCAHHAEEILEQGAVESRRAAPLPLNQHRHLDRRLQPERARRQRLNLRPETAHIVYLVVDDLSAALQFLERLQTEPRRGHVHERNVVSKIQALGVDGQHNVKDLLIVDVGCFRAEHGKQQFGRIRRC